MTVAKHCVLLAVCCSTQHGGLCLDGSDGSTKASLRDNIGERGETEYDPRINENNEGSGGNLHDALVEPRARTRFIAADPGDDPQPCRHNRGGNHRQDVADGRER